MASIGSQLKRLMLGLNGSRMNKQEMRWEYFKMVPFGKRQVARAKRQRLYMRPAISGGMIMQRLSGDEIRVRESMKLRDAS